MISNLQEARSAFFLMIPLIRRANKEAGPLFEDGLQIPSAILLGPMPPYRSRTRLALRRLDLNARVALGSLARSDPSTIKEFAEAFLNEYADVSCALETAETIQGDAGAGRAESARNRSRRSPRCSFNGFITSFSILGGKTARASQ